MKDGFQIRKGTDNFDRIVKHAERGALQGKYLGFPNLKQHYNMSFPGVTDWTGFPQSGKTQVLMEFLVNCSEYYGLKHLIYMPDVGAYEDIISDIIHKRTGKTFEKKYDNHISEFDIAAEMPWIDEHFYILDKTDVKAKMTPYEFWDQAIALQSQYGIHSATIDSWKDMSHKHDFSRGDLYLEDVLSYRNNVADKYGLHLHTIIHPLKTDKDPDGIRAAPGPYDLKGGSEWYNNGRNIITVHRNNTEKYLTEIYFHKIKPRSIGIPGMAKLYFDIKTLRYYWKEMDGTQIFAQEKYKPSKVELIQNLEDDGQGELQL